MRHKKFNCERIRLKDSKKSDFDKAVKFIESLKKKTFGETPCYDFAFCFNPIPRKVEKT